MLILVFLLFSGCSSIPTIPKEKRSQYAQLKEEKPSNPNSPILLVRVDKHSVGIFGEISVEVLPGTHNIQVAYCPKYNKTCEQSYYSCDVVAGYIYITGLRGCTKVNRRMDFDGADKYWADFDAAERAKAITLQEERERNEYQEFKNNLPIADREGLEKIINSVEKRMRFGIQKDDPDGLIVLAKQRLEPFVVAEQKQNETDAANAAKAKAVRDAKEAKERAIKEKEEAARLVKERQEILAFR